MRSSRKFRLAAVLTAGVCLLTAGTGFAAAAEDSGYALSGGSDSTASDSILLPPAGAAPDSVTGDLNRDGRINAADLTLLKRGILAKSDDSGFKSTADVNESGAVNALDAEMLRDFLIGKISRFEKGEWDGPTGPVVYPKSYDFPSVSQIRASDAVPDPFIFMDGSKVETQDDWWKRQAEISCMYEYYMYGVWRDGSDDEVSYSVSGSKMTVTVKRKSTGKTASFETNVSLPSRVRHEGSLYSAPDSNLSVLFSSLTLASEQPATQHLPIPLATTAACEVIPPLSVRMPSAATMPARSSGEVSALTRRTFSPLAAASDASSAVK